MSVKMAIAALTLACGLPAAGFAAGPAVTPNMATGHVPPGPGRTQAVTEKANQILAGKVIGLSVRVKGDYQVATIVDLVVDKKQGRVDLAVLEPGGSAAYKGGRIAVAWKSLHFQPVPTPRFFTALSPQQLAHGTPFKEEARHNPAYYDVKADLLSQHVVGSHGAPIGTIKDLVLDLGSGRLVALIIDTSGFAQGGAQVHAVAWGAAKPHGRNPIHLAVSRKAVVSAPVITSMAPQPTPYHSNMEVPATVGQDQTGNISGTSVPGPAVRR
ncbi:MAG TPA: PRC-barrel domain-containing protein [Stellaceae bacterium]|nr:PRC-barrel domain-containing protein [Stellaceae bacterium]